MYYSMSIGTGAGVFFLETSSKERVKHEIDNLPDGWMVNIWLFNCDDTPIKKCNIDEF